MAFIAVVEDDPETGDYLRKLLSYNGFSAILYPTPGRFLDSLKAKTPDLVICDMQLPGIDGKEVIRVLRSNPQTKKTFVIAVSGKQCKTSDVVEGLHSGADEYLIKPINADLLLARIQSLLRRTQEGAAPAQEVLRVGALTVELDSRHVRCGAKDIQLTRLEFDLLVYLLRNPNRVLPRSLILQTVWGDDAGTNARTVDKHVESLRRKLKPLGSKIETMVRVGYILRL